MINQRLLQNEPGLAAGGPMNEVFDIEKHMPMTAYQQIYLTLDECDRNALDLREKYENQKKYYREDEGLCMECGEHGALTEFGTCTPCYIDECIYQDADLQMLVSLYFIDEMVNDENFQKYAEKYVEYTKKLDDRITARVREAEAKKAA